MSLRATIAEDSKWLDTPSTAASSIICNEEFLVHKFRRQDYYLEIISGCALLYPPFYKWAGKPCPYYIY